MHASHLKLCLITNLQYQTFDSYQHFIVQAIRGGVTAVQLRVKQKTSSELLDLAIKFKTLLKTLHTPLIINDHVDIAKEIDADGVHLGQSDLSPFAARQILGPEKIIGWSVETLEDLDEANQLTCIDYIAASAVFPSVSKLDCKTIWGIEGLQKITRASKYPVVAIGGINVSNIASVMDSGACGVAVIHAIHDDANPYQAATDLIHAINARKTHV